MSCTTNTTSCTPIKKSGCGYVTIIVLYILLAIILSSVIC